MFVLILFIVMIIYSRFYSFVIAVLASAFATFLIGCHSKTEGLENLQSFPENTSVPSLVLGPENQPALLFVTSNDDSHALQFKLWENDAWSTGQTIAEDSLMLVNWADRPQMSFGADGAAYAHWLRLDPRGDFAYTIQAVRSSDSGTTWSKPTQPHSDTAIAEHGFAQWMPFDGGAALAWLDGRNFDGHPDLSKAPMEVRMARWLASETWSDELVLDSSACTCCPMAALGGQDGSYELVYRDRTDGEIRDFNRLHIQPHSGEWQDLGLLHSDGWEIAACPVNGASLSQNDTRSLAIWYTGANNEPQVKFAWRTDPLKSFEPPTKIHQNTPLGRVVSTTDMQGDFYALWLETNETGGVDWMGQRWDASGIPQTESPESLIPASERRAGGFPTAVGLEKGVLIAWTNPFPKPHVMTAIWY